MWQKRFEVRGSGFQSESSFFEFPQNNLISSKAIIRIFEAK
jgi:hypothetical protein